jgi:hypothetical protein
VYWLLLRYSEGVTPHILLKAVEKQFEYDEEGLKFTWSVENIGDYSVSFDKNMIAQIVLNGEDYAFETEAVTLEPGEAYSVDISIPYPVARQNGTNNVKITATTGDTTATYKESFTH